MCGICGIVWQDPNRPTPAGAIERMTDRIAHRGPDGSGFHHESGVAFGHRRLSIIDLAGGAQPMANDGEDIWITFNGEIYNFESLRGELLAVGRTFKTRSDTEVLLQLYEQYGPAMLPKLRGMFAFGIWDRRHRSLLLARDRLGKKPLVYQHDAEGLRFASELKSLVSEPGFSKELDVSAFDDYLALQYVPHPKTIYKAARKLPPGHCAIYRNGDLRIEPYWQLPYEREVAGSEAEYSQQLRSKLTEATRLRMIADVPLGAFLSGGIDSTIVVGLMQQLSTEPVRTFSIGFPVKEYDETSFAREAARHLKTQHQEFIVEPQAVAVIEKLAWHYDEPFADSSAIPTYYVSQLTRQHVTVALTGDAGDELFAGYDRYKAVRIGTWFQKLPRPAQALLTARIWQSLPASPRQKSKVRRAKKLLAWLGTPTRQQYRQWVTIFDRPLRRSLLSPSMQESLGDYEPLHWVDGLFDRFPERDILTQTTAADLLSYLPCDILTKVDIASMAHGLECRSPFLDHEVVALAGRMPVGMKMRGLTTKSILKRTFAELLPPSIRRRGKMGFGVPLDHWFRHELKESLQDTLGSQRCRERGWFEASAVQKLLDDHLQGKWDHSARIWALFMLEKWATVWLDC